jgi:hypothetical protein
MKEKVMKRSIVVFGMLFILMVVAGCKITSATPDAGKQIVMNQGDTLTFEVKLAAPASYQEWTIKDPEDLIGLNAFPLANTLETVFKTTADNVGKHQIQYKAERYIFIPIVPNTDIGITFKLWEVKRKWDVQVNGVMINPNVKGISPANSTAKLTAALSYPPRCCTMICRT